MKSLNLPTKRIQPVLLTLSKLNPVQQFEARGLQHKTLEAFQLEQQSFYS